MADSAAETGQETMGQLLKDFHPNVRSIIRRTEKIWRKIKKKEISVVFNEFCIKESLLPKYTICEHVHVCVFSFLSDYVHACYSFA